MPEIDPLALRHGVLIRQAWRDINFARRAARNGDDPQPLLVRLRSVRRRVVAAHEMELLRSGAPTSDVDAWFSEVEEVLAKAEAYFSASIAPQPARVQPPVKPPATLYPLADA